MSFLSGLGSGYLGVWSNIGNGIGSALNKITGVESQQNKTYKQQKAAMELQNQYNKEMWNLQNEYNSPSAQLARMADAGIEINPTAYALGSSNLSNTAGFVGSENGFAGSGGPAGNPISALMGIAQGVQGLRESRARVSNLDAQNSNIKAENANITAQTERLDTLIEQMGIQNAIMRHNLNYAQSHGTPVNMMPSVNSSLAGFMNEVAQNGVANTAGKYYKKSGAKKVVDVMFPAPWEK